MALNVRLLRRVKRHILAEPGRLWMSDWCIRTEPNAVIGGYEAGLTPYCENPNRKAPACGTVACIAGWATMLADPRADWITGSSGAKALGISWANDYHRLLHIHPLFHIPGWPEDLAHRYYKAKTQRQRALIAAERIERYIEECGFKRKGATE